MASGWVFIIRARPKPLNRLPNPKRRVEFERATLDIN
jgi:hypothetical protein